MDYSQERICVEKILPQHQAAFNAIHHQANSPFHLQKLRAAFFTQKLWPNGTKITIGFLSDGKTATRTPLLAIKDLRGKNGDPLKMDPLQNSIDSLSIPEAIKKIVQERIQPLVNLHFEFINDASQANIRIAFDANGGAWSLVGTDCLHEKSKATMNFAWFDVATAMHEFGHALGMVHEHQNPKGNPIDWNVPKVYAWAQSTQGWDKQTTQQNIIDRYQTNQINGSVFDPLSIMLYFFPASLTLNNEGTHQNLRLSGYDVEYISKMYPGGTISPSKFYPKVYSQSLSSARAESKGKTKSGGIIVIIVILTILVVILGMKWSMNRKKVKK